MARRPIDARSEAAREADKLLKEWRQKRGIGTDSPLAQRDHGEEMEDWVISYMDMVTLLMIVFLGMVAILGIRGELKINSDDRAPGSTLAFRDTILPGAGGGSILPVPPVPNYRPEREAQRDAAPGRDQGAEPGKPQTGPQPAMLPDTAAGQSDQLSPQAKDLAEKLNRAGIGDDVQVSQRAQAIVIEIRDRILFAPGQAELTPAGRQTLVRLANSLKTLPGLISVEGHTDDVPISSARFASNWELSAGRAIAVLRLLADQGVPQSRLRAIAYADTRPVSANPEGRALNRRVTLSVGG